MDPLSIATGAAALAGTVTTISIWLYDLIRDVGNIDTKVVDLAKEVSRLMNLLSSVEKTVRQCQSLSLTLAHLDDHMWQQIDNALVDCKVTVEELDRVTMKIGGEHGAEPKGLGRLLKKPSMQFRFAIHEDEVEDLTQKIYKSNCSMQTALAVVNVSLTFRTHVSQESLFDELRHLQKLVKESLKAAAQRQDAPQIDPFAARQSRNLENLAKAAQRFHVAASSTASIRSSLNWGGSEAGSLTHAQRERIEMWNDRNTEWNDLDTVEEAPEDGSTDVTSNSMSIPADNSTTITLPDTDDKDLPSATGKGKSVERGLDAEEVSSEDDDSDVEYDFLRNFEQLAYTSFMGQDYAKAERCLRMAVERSTGDIVNSADFNLLKAKLAICCCLQEKWDHAAGLVASLPKGRTPSNLPTFHLLHAIALAHLQTDRFDDAYDACKMALQGKKKILGKTSAGYYECLAVFAAIYDKKGEPLAAEAVRHSIPQEPLYQFKIYLLSAKQYILQHKTLVDSVFKFQKPPAVTDSETGLPLSNPASPDPVETAEKIEKGPASGHWSTLVPSSSNQRDGTQRAETDERRGTVVEETDTGKEFLAQPMVNPPPVPSTNPWAQHVNSSYKDVNNTKPQSPAVVTPSVVVTPVIRPPTPPTRPPGPPPQEAAVQRSVSTGHRRGNLWAAASEYYKNTTSHQDDDVAASTSNNRKESLSPPTSGGLQRSLSASSTVNRPLGHQRLIDKVQNAAASLGQDLPVRPESSSSRVQEGGNSPQDKRQEPQQSSSSSSSPMYIEHIPNKRGIEYISTMEVVPLGTWHQYIGPSPYDFSITSPTSSLISPDLRNLDHSRNLSTSSKPKTRWIVVKDIGNIGGERPFGPAGLPQFLPNHSTRNEEPDPSNFSVAFASRLGIGASDSFAISKGKDQVVREIPYMAQPTLDTESFTTGPSSSAAGMLGVRKLIRRIKSNASRGSGLGPLRFSVDLAAPRQWNRDANKQFVTKDKSTQRSLGLVLPENHVTETMREMEYEIASEIRQGQYYGLSSEQLFAALRVDAVVCALPDMFLDPETWPTTVSELADCPLFQHSKVIPHSYAVMQYYIDSGFMFPSYCPPTARNFVVVLTCDDWLVECRPYMLSAVSPDYFEVHEGDSVHLTELAGVAHVTSTFIELARQKVALMNNQFRHKMEQTTVDEILASCCRHLHQNIIPEFHNDGVPWLIDYEMPQDFAAFRHGRFHFECDEILGCFMPSVRMIAKMVVTTMERLKMAHGVVPSHILLAGLYANSKFLKQSIWKALEEHSTSMGSSPPVLLDPRPGDDVYALGALSHARRC